MYVHRLSLYDWIPQIVIRCESMHNKSDGFFEELFGREASEQLTA